MSYPDRAENLFNPEMNIQTLERLGNPIGMRITCHPAHVWLIMLRGEGIRGGDKMYDGSLGSPLYAIPPLPSRFITTIIHY